MADFTKNKGAIAEAVRSLHMEWETIGSVVFGTIGTVGTKSGTSPGRFNSAWEIMFSIRGTQAAGGSPDCLMSWYNMPDGTNLETNEQGSWSIPTVSAAGFRGPSKSITSGFGERISVKVINDTATSIMSDVEVDIFAR